MSLSQRLNRRVTLQSKTEAQDDTGEVLPGGWTNFVTDGDGAIWAEVLDLTGREFISANAEQSRVQTKVTIRHRAGITTAMRLLYKGVAYDIKAVLGQDNRSLLLMCESEANV